MKYLLALISFWSVQSFAADYCPSAWVHPVHKAVQPEFVRYQRLSTPFLRGDAGKDQHGLCANLEREFNAQNSSQGYLAVLVQPTPVAERTGQQTIGHKLRQWDCSVSVMKVTEVRWDIHHARYRDLAPPNSSCFTCDNSGLEGAATATKTACLKRSIQASRDVAHRLDPRSNEELRVQIQNHLSSQQYLSVKIPDPDVQILIEFQTRRTR